MQKEDRVLAQAGVIALAVIAFAQIQPTLRDALVALVTPVTPYEERVWTFLNTNFSAALFGALAGALGAHIIATRAERRRELAREIAAVNNAIELANGISNTFLGIKRQHVQPLVSRYEADFLHFSNFTTQPHPPTVYTFIADFRVWEMPLTGMPQLSDTILSRVQSATRAISISAVLYQCLNSLASVFRRRLETIQNLRRLNDQARVLTYFGLRMPAGDIDESYPNEIEGLSTYTDDAIYFSMLLAEILIAHGKRLAKRYGRRAPPVTTLHYERIEGLLPDPANYPDFEKIRAEIGAQPKSRSWAARIKAMWPWGSPS